jgi:serine/threonine protein kinase
LRGSQHLTAKSDQYSLGVVLYECATGRRPHEGNDLARLVRSITSDPVEPLRQRQPNISRELDAAVMRALSRRPEDRFDHVRELGAALWSLASKRTQHVWAKRFSASPIERTLSLGSPSAPALTRKRQRFSPVIGAAAAIGLLLLAGGVALFWFRARARAGVPIAAVVSAPQRAPENAPPERAAAHFRPFARSPNPWSI